VVLAGHPTREAPGQTVHAIFQQVTHPATHASPCLILLPAPSSTAMLLLTAMAMLWLLMHQNPVQQSGSCRRV